MMNWLKRAVSGLVIVGLVSTGGCSDDYVPADSAPPALDSGDDGASADAAGPDVGATSDAGADTVPAHQPNLTCVGVPFPDPVPDPVTVSGQVRTLIGVPVAGTVEVRSLEDDALIDSMTASADGQYTLTVPTGGAAKLVYFHVVAEGFVDTYRFFGYPLTASTTSSQRVWTASQVQRYAAGGGITPTAGKGHLRISTRDCALKLTQAGSVITTTPAAPMLAYEKGDACDIPDQALSETTICSHAMAYDLDPGSVTIEATRGELTFRTQTVKVVADGMTWVTLQPARP